MGISTKLKNRIKNFSDEDKERLVRMGWEDRTTFDVIEKQFGLTQNEFIRFMRTALDPKAYDRWRKRANQKGHLKHEKKRGTKYSRFKAARQSTEGVIKRTK